MKLCQREGGGIIVIFIGVILCGRIICAGKLG